MKPSYAVLVFILCILVKLLLQFNKIPILNKFLFIKLIHIPYSSESDAQSLPPDRLELNFTPVSLKFPILLVFHGFVYHFRSAQHRVILADLQQLISNGLISNIDENSRILEVGCNTGALISKIQKKYPAQFYGMDIDDKSILFAQKAFRHPKTLFFRKNVLTKGLFEEYPNNFFTHVFSFSHMVHIPWGEPRDEYLEELQRIGQNIVLKERIYPPRKNRFVDDFESMPFTLAHVSHKLDSPIGVGLLYFNKRKYNSLKQ
tara:strand:+ start:610 stop:1389 length:780 start_codon:yes stop_codon:yes gene_type:complete